MKFERWFSGATWESKVGYCRAIKAGNNIYLSGTVAVGDDGKPFVPGDAYTQARRCFEIIEKALKNLGADISNVVRIRMFVTDISRSAEYGKAHFEFFGANPPANSMIEIKSLIDPAYLIEAEADAVC
jgi:enamine deaminase RidA (YjgF/YER057c/UK114 family)